MKNAKEVAKATTIAGLIIYAIISGLYWLASQLTRFFGFPSSLGSEPALKLGGWALLIAGGALVLWLLRYRSPATMLVSTYHTFLKMFGLSSMSKNGGRTEPLIVEGPQKYVRHPLYLSASISFLGWAMITESSSSLIGCAFIFAWFRFVQIPFEEKELRTIFGEQYNKYCETVPMLIPIRRKRIH